MFSKRFVRWSVLFILAVGFILLLRLAGSFLVKSDSLIKSDAIIVLMGSIPDRVLYAADLYHQGIAPRIIIVDPDNGPWDKLITRGVKPVFGAEQFIDVAVQLGIPDSCMLVIPGEAKSTQQEAQIIARYLKSHPEMDTITLVTTINHTRRAGLIFRKIFHKENLDVELIVSPSPYSTQDLKHWWKNRDEIETVIFEWIKIATFVLVEQWKI